jgi:hypothetical protein
MTGKVFLASHSDFRYLIHDRNPDDKFQDEYIIQNYLLFRRVRAHISYKTLFQQYSQSLEHGTAQ